ncbi:hypothetical protein LEP1GSC120_2701 [Leptospira santarosai str. 200702252]|nr:hypothetical protein LEP1GSC130_1478 [Leptospira santarosai str. 200403458]EMP00012.1 hypothetical protein LEP1GSC120_2701 [Leptospira santarosai str. 200702252]
MRWKIEVFHKILKSGCKAEESKLRTADRLKKIISKSETMDVLYVFVRFKIV